MQYNYYQKRIEDPIPGRAKNNQTKWFHGIIELAVFLDNNSSTIPFRWKIEVEDKGDKA